MTPASRIICCIIILFWHKDCHAKETPQKIKEFFFLQFLSGLSLTVVIVLMNFISVILLTFVSDPLEDRKYLQDEDFNSSTSNEYFL